MATSRRSTRTSGMFAKSRLLMSEMRRRTFADVPCRFRLRLDVLPFRGTSKPPHSTRCSFLGISALPKFGPDLLERDRSKLADGARRQAVALIDVLAVPSTGERFDDPGCFPAMPIEGVVELGARGVVYESFAGTDMFAELTAQVVVEAALGQAREKLACQSAEAIAGREKSD